LKVETDDIDEFVNRDMDNGNLENAHINTAVNVENHLFSQYLDAMAKDESYKYQKFDETVKKVRRNFYESEQGKFLLKEKVVAVELDHSYAGGNSQCFDGGNVDVGELVSSNEMEKASDESIDIGDFYDESSKENGDDEVCDDGNLVLGDCMNKISCVEEEENEVFDDGIVKLEIAEEPLNVVACDYSTGDVDDAEAEDGEQKELVRGDEPLINIGQAVVDDAEDKSLDEYYAELDSSDKKEIEKQLTEDLDESFNISIKENEANDVSISPESNDLKTVVDTSNHLLLECVDDLVVKPSCIIADENGSDVDKLEESVDENLDKRSSHSSTDSNFSSPEVGTKFVTVEYLASQSDYFKTRPSMLKIWKSNDSTLEEDSDLPQGWRTKVYKRKSGRVDLHYITPENLDIRSKFGVVEYMRLSENYDKEEVNRVARNLSVSVDPL